MRQGAVVKGKERPHESVLLKVNRLFFYGWVVVVMAALVQFVAMGVQQSFGVFLRPMIEETGWGRGLTGSVLSVYMAVQATFAFVLGALSDKYGIRRILVVAGLFMTVGLMLVAVVGAPWQLYLFLALMAGIGKGASYTPIASVVTRWFTTKRGLAFGILTSGGGMAGVVFPILAGSLIAHFGWRMSYAIFGLIALGGFLPAVLLVRTEPKELGLLPYGQKAPAGADVTEKGTMEKTKVATLQNEEANHWSLAQAVKTYTFWSIALSYLMWQFTYSVVFAHMVAFATDLGASLMIGATILSIISGVGIPGRLVWGIAADRWGRKNILGLCLFMEALAMFSLLTVREPWMLYIYAVFFGFIYAGCLPLFPALAADAFGGKSYGAILGAVFTISVLGASIGPTVAGYIFDLTRSYDLAFVATGLALFLAVGLNYFMRISRHTLPAGGGK